MLARLALFQQLVQLLVQLPGLGDQRNFQGSFTVRLCIHRGGPRRGLGRGDLGGARAALRGRGGAGGDGGDGGGAAVTATPDEKHRRDKEEEDQTNDRYFF